MTIEEFNKLDAAIAKAELIKCCGSDRWAGQLAKKRPFQSVEELIETSDEIWRFMAKPDFLEAFSHHPKIGDMASLQKKFASTQAWATTEQSGVQKANDTTLQALSAGNATYEKRYGYIFIVCATGKSAAEMVALLNDRLENDSERELQTAANEQNKITHLRLKKLFS